MKNVNTIHNHLTYYIVIQNVFNVMFGMKKEKSIIRRSRSSREKEKCIKYRMKEILMNK